MPGPQRIVCALALAVVCGRALADDAFRQQVKPFLETYCVRCHNPKTTEGDLDLTRYASSAGLGESARQWEHVLTFLRKGEMPPEKASQPTSDERSAAIGAIENILAAESKKLAGDPGVVLPRRLTNAEFNYTVRDLTGADIRPADSFPVDPASGEGFNNTGEALVISPQLFKKYYAAAQFVAEHAALTPTGMRFAPYPVVTFADQTKFYEQAIIGFYEQQDVVYEKYLSAAWSYRHRPPSRRDATIDAWAAEQHVSPKYLAILWETLLGSPSDDKFYLGWIRRRWHALPPPADAANPTAPPELAQQIAALAETIRGASTLLCAKETPPIVPGAGNGPVMHIDRRKKSAAERDAFDEQSLAATRRLRTAFRDLKNQATIKIVVRATSFQPGAAEGYVILSDMIFSSQPEQNYRPAHKQNLSLRDVLAKDAPEQWERLNPGVHPLGHAIDPGSIVVSTATPLEITVSTAAFADQAPMRLFVEATLDREHSSSAIIGVTLTEDPPTADVLPTMLVDRQSPLADEFKAAGAELCRAFPNRFVYVDATRGLSAGFHLVEGFFRDDVPLCKLVLSEDQNRDLDRLWDELYFGAGVIEKMLRGFVFFEREERKFLRHADFNLFQAEDPELVKEEVLNRFEQVFLLHSGVKQDDPQLAQHPIHLFFEEFRQGLKRRADQLASAKPVYLRQLLELAERAYRRPLADAERAQLESFYESACRQPELGVEQAVRGVVTSLLVSPYFCCRVDIPPDGDTVRPLAEVALASRLSYFLWSSMPDAELLSLAKADRLHEESTLRREVRRMIQDPKISGLALEFFGQWLRYRDFNGEESVDRKVFPAFNDALKQAMFEEPTRLITWLMQNNLPITDVLYGDTTLVNKPLAEHYGFPYRAGGDEWQPVDGLRQFGRGGVLGMAVFLTKNSQPQRTSPVKRGFWVVHKILGEHIPPPPANVAVLPAKETETLGKTIRQLLAMHTEAEDCARCHRRFDPIGLSMEGFDPIGHSRDKDLAGRSVDNAVPLPSGDEARGLPEFLNYLRANRTDEFVKTFCRNFLGYALGRSLELSDRELLNTMQANLRQNDYRFGTLIETVVCSPQFRNQRCKDFSLARFRAQSQGE